MSLSKNYTLAQVRGLLILWMNELNISSLDPDLVDDFINLATMDCFSDLKDTIFKLYGRTTSLADSGSAFAATTLGGGTFTHSTKTIYRSTGHNLTNADIGKRVILGRHVVDPNRTTHVTITNILSITDSTHFVVLHSPGIDLPGLGDDLGGDYIPGDTTPTFFYQVLPRHSELQLDLSALRIFSIRKINDDVNGEYVEVNDARDFENLFKYPQKQNKVYFYQNGEIIKLYKGTNIAALGTITLDYFGYPAIPAAETEYLDIPDQHIGLVIQKAQNYIISHKQKSGLPIPVETKQNTQRETNASAQSQIANKK